jgi:hypothetical protein
MTPKIFISHSHQDRDFVDWLVRELRQNGIDVWWDADELAVGDYIKDKIKEGILASSAFIIVLSEQSTKSAWVQFELNSALLYNATKNNIKIIPIKIDESNVPLDLNNYLYIDASRNRLTALENIIRALYVPDKPTYKFDDWSNFSAKSFEDFIYDLLKFEGHNINRMPQMRDSGFDFEIEDINSFLQKERTLVECKLYKSSVSIATLSQLHGVLQESNASKALLITNSELTSASKAYLSKLSNQIHVWEGHDLIKKFNKFPELLLKYFPKSVPQKEPVKLIDGELQVTQNLIKELENCPEGMGGWKEYESICIKILKFLFVPPLSEPKVQSRRESGIDIRDAIFPNRATNNANWQFIREDYDAKYVVIEFKNYAEDGAEIDKHVVLQIDDYLKKTMGRFGIICSKKMPNDSGLQKRKDIFIEHNKLILFVNNEHLKDMLLRKYKKMDPSDVIIDMIDDFSLKF